MTLKPQKRLIAYKATWLLLSRIVKETEAYANYYWIIWDMEELYWQIQTHKQQAGAQLRRANYRWN